MAKPKRAARDPAPECSFCRSPVRNGRCTNRAGCGVAFPRGSLAPDGMFHAAKRAKHGMRRTWVLRFLTTLDRFPKEMEYLGRARKGR